MSGGEQRQNYHRQFQRKEQQRAGCHRRRMVGLDQDEMQKQGRHGRRGDPPSAVRHQARLRHSQTMSRPKDQSTATAARAARPEASGGAKKGSCSAINVVSWNTQTALRLKPLRQRAAQPGQRQSHQHEDVASEAQHQDRGADDAGGERVQRENQGERRVDLHVEPRPEVGDEALSPREQTVHPVERQHNCRQRRGEPRPRAARDERRDQERGKPPARQRHQVAGAKPPVGIMPPEQDAGRRCACGIERERRQPGRAGRPDERHLRQREERPRQCRRRPQSRVPAAEAEAPLCRRSAIRPVEEASSGGV